MSRGDLPKSGVALSTIESEGKIWGQPAYIRLGVLNEGIRGELKGTICLNQARLAQQRNQRGGKKDNLPESGKARTTKESRGRETRQPALISQRALNKGIRGRKRGQPP